MVSPVRVRVPPLLFSSILHGYGFPRTTLLGNLVNRGKSPPCTLQLFSAVRRARERYMLGLLHRCGRCLHFLAHVGRTEKMHALSSVARETFALRWRPSGDTAVALLTAVLMVGFYYANTRAAQGSVFSLVVFVILTNGVLNVLFPAYYVLVVRREGLDQLGITKRWWWLALLLSAVVSVLSWPQLQDAVAQHPGTDRMPLRVVGIEEVFGR